MMLLNIEEHKNTLLLTDSGFKQPNSSLRVTHTTSIFLEKWNSMNSMFSLIQF
jgi:hypothetical protein